MPRKRYRPEDILSKLREADIHISQGKTVAETIRVLGISDVSYYRWRKEYGGMTTSQVKRLYERNFIEKLICLATIYRFVIQNLTQYIHCISWYFRNDSRPLTTQHELVG